MSQPTSDRKKWTGNLFDYATGKMTEPVGVVQNSEFIQGPMRERKHIVLPEGILRLAHREYENQYGHQQDYERMQERSGLSVSEVITLLADLAERHGATPTEPRKVAARTHDSLKSNDERKP